MDRGGWIGSSLEPAYIWEADAAAENPSAAMTPAEQATLNSSLQQKATDEASDDEISDALLGTIAEAVKQNAKTKDEVKAIFKGQVDPKKAKDKKK